MNLQKDLPEYVGHKTAHRVVLQLLHPDCPWYLPPSLAGIVHPEPKILQTTSEAGDDASEGDKVKSEMDVKEASDDDEEDGDVAIRPSGPLGLSKKDANLRRKELFVGAGLGKALVTLCTDSAAELLAMQHAADVLVEVCRGGEGGVLEEVVGEESIDAVQAATVAAAIAKNDGDGSKGEQLLQSYFGSRALRRLVLASRDQGRAGKAAQRFVKLLWERGLKGRCAEIRASHAAKVLGAVVHSACPAVGAAVKELELSGVDDVSKWADTFTARANKNK
jgi:pumilio family protein 6